ncbi:MAG TPA: tubulin-like doman-containing protein [Myxococcales bacterium]
MHDNKIAPCFFIGLGGCGGAVVNEIARKVKQDEADWRRYKDLVHFFVLDTDQDDVARCTWVDSNHRFVISDFDKPGYVDLKVGKTHKEADPHFLQWWPEHYRPRSTRGKGAGQIRIESRLSLNYQLENDAGGILGALKAAIARAYDVQNPFRANKAAKVYLYASLAGGTGSGGSAVMAANLRKLLSGRGHHLTGTFVLPNVFRNQGLPLNQFDKIMTNGYAALVEIEHLQTANDRDAFGFAPFHFDPNDENAKGLNRPLFDQVYLVDAETSAGLVIADPKLVYPAIGDAAYAQIFGSILEKEHSTLDNDTRELAALDENDFTKSYGSFGVSAMVLPAKDILEYFSTRYAAEVMHAAFAGGGGTGGGSSDPEAPDHRFAEELEASARLSGEKGEVAKSAVDWAGDTGKGAVADFARWCDELREQLAKDLKLPSWKEEDLLALEGQEGVSDELNKKWNLLKKRLGEAHEAAGQAVDRTLKEVKAKGSKGSLSDRCEGQGPIRERYFLVRLRDALRERQGAEAQAYDRVKDFTPGNVESAFAGLRDRLAKYAPKTVRDLVGSDYKPVVAEFKPWQDGVVQKSAEQFRSKALARFYEEIVREITARLRKAGGLFDRANDIERMIAEKAERLLKAGGAREHGGAANEYVLDVEVYQNHLTGERYWEHLYRERAVSDSGVANALDAVRSASEGAVTEDEMRTRVLDALVGLGRERFRKDVLGHQGQGGLRMDEGLQFEARTALAVFKLAEPGKAPPTAQAVAEERARVSQRDVDRYLADKFEFAGRKCKPFVALYSGGQYLPDKNFATAFKPYFETLGPFVTAIPSHPVERQNVIEATDPHRIVFYSAKLGVTLHSVRTVTEYAQHYRVVQADELSRGKPWPPPEGPKVPDIPLHIDKGWERAPGEGLFDVDLESLKGERAKKAWREKRLAAAAAETVRAAREKDLKQFVLGLVFEHIKLRPEGYAVADPAKDRPLHRFRDRAFEAYVALHADVKGWLAAEVGKALGKLVDERRHDELAKLLGKAREGVEALRRATDLPEEKDHYSRELDALQKLADEHRVKLG